MKLIFTAIILLTGNLILLAQTMSENTFKYWYYRDRLKYFVYPGTEEGASVLMTSRNSNGNGGVLLQYNGAEWGQTRKINGYYIGMLATEYKLLIENGDYSSAQVTLNELNLALDALIRMDKCEDIAPWDVPSEFYDGFFIRSDVPPVLSSTMASYLNQNVPTGSYSDFVNAYVNGRKGYPFAIAPEVVMSARRFESNSNYYYQNHQIPTDGFLNLIAEYSKENEKYWLYWKADKFTSNDEIVGTYMGLALVAKCVNVPSVKYKAIEIAEKIKHFALGNDSENPFQMRFPDGTIIKAENGGNSTGIYYSIQKSYDKMLNIPTTSPVGFLPYALALKANVQTNTSSFDRGMYSKMVAISDAVGTYNNAADVIHWLSKGEQWDVFYLMLWAVIFDKNLTQSSFSYPFEQLLLHLNTAPCSGPYKYNYPENPNLFSMGWACEYKYDADYNGQQFGGSRTGIFPGIDYMLLFNLACLAFPTGFDYEGQHYAFPYYVNQNNRKLQNEYAPLYLPGGTPSPEIASVSRPAEVRAISSITTNMVISNQAKVFSLTPSGEAQYISGINGDVSLKAGESIILSDGFRVDAGAHFLAKIESYSCNGLPYKNANAPIWDEHYKISFYDTLASIPLEKREAVHYNDETSNITGGDFLWDESGYASDSSASPGFPVSVSLSPNPCTTFSTLTINPGQKVFLRIALLDVHGQTKTMLFEGNCEPPMQQIGFDMSAYPNGIYFIRVASDGSSSTFKLMKE